MTRIKQGVIIAAIVAALIAVLEVTLAFCGVRSVLYDEDPYVGFSGRLPLFVQEMDEDGQPTDRLTTAKNKQKHFNSQQFPKKKAKDTYRIFCLGGSTTYGRPYNDKTSFCGWLREMLPEADPSRTWEVINAGGISYASYRVSVLMEELSQYEPDLFIVYSGHNEFLERRTYPRLIEMPKSTMAFGTKLRRLRSYTVARRIGTSLRKSGAQMDAGKDYLPAEVDAMLDFANGPWAYERDDMLRGQVLDHYRYNLLRMTDIARDVGARVLFVTTPVNLRDSTPFKSTNSEGLNEDELRQWEALVEQWGEAQSAKQWNEALAALDAAAGIDDRHARLHFQRGKTLQALGDHGKAKASFERAVDEDVCPLRALPAMTAILREVAKERESLLVDFVSWADNNAEDGIPGADLFLDHVHPTIESNRQLALMLMESMEDDGIVSASVSWGPKLIEAIRYTVIGSLRPQNHCKALWNLSYVLKWGGKFEEAESKVVRAMELYPSDGELLYAMAMQAEKDGKPDEAKALYRQVIRLDPEFVRAYLRIGDLLSAKGQNKVALVYYYKALQVRPDYVLAYKDLGDELATLRRYDEAVDTYEYALRLAPDWADVHLNLGRTLSAMNKLDEAQKHFRNALRLEPGMADAHYELGRVLFVQARWTEAAHHYEQVCRLMPDNESARKNMQHALAQLQKVEDARLGVPAVSAPVSPMQTTRRDTR